MALVKGLGRSRCSTLSGKLVQVLTDSAIREYVRRSVADALGELGAADAVEPLMEIWRSSSEDRLRERALLALARIGTPGAWDVVLGALPDRNVDRTIRRNLADSLRPVDDADVNERLLDAALSKLNETDIPAAFLAIVARFSSSTGRIVYPEDASLAPIEYSWSHLGPCGKGVS